MNKKLDIRDMVGQKLMVGLAGPEVDEDFLDIVRKYKAGNVILFKRNIKSMEQFKRLCGDIQRIIKAETGFPALIGVDEEGGCVSRMPEDGVTFPAAMGIAATESVENAVICAELTADMLLSHGANFVFAPVVDVNTNRNNPIIGGRSYGEDPYVVSEYAQAVYEAYDARGIMTSAKHFPGHGNTDVDSHLGLPRIDKDVDELFKAELIPYEKLIKAGVPAIMTTHILFPKIEPENIPGTMSRKIVTDLLRDRMGFKGLVVSDCMEMDAIKKHYGVGEGCRKAAAAGVDIMIISRTFGTSEYQRQGAEAMYEDIQKALISEEELRESAERIIRYKEKYIKDRALTFDKERALAEARRIRVASVTHINGDIPRPGKDSVFIGCINFRVVIVSDKDEHPAVFCEYMSNRFGGDCLVTSENPSEEEIKRAVEFAKGHDSIFVNTYNAHSYRGQAALANALADTGIKTCVVTLRDPYDFCYITDRATRLCGWDYNIQTLEVLGDVFSGKEIPAGRIPVRLEDQ